MSGDLSLTIKGISAFLANANSIIEGKKVENGTTYLAYYVRRTADGNWRRWLKGELYILDCNYHHRRNKKSLSNELRICSVEDAYAEWGFDKFISRETLLGTDGYVRNDELQLGLDLECGMDIFSEESEAHRTNAKLVVQGHPVFVNKDLLSINSPMFARLFKQRAGSDRLTQSGIALPEANLAGLLHFLRVIYPPYEELNAGTVKAVYQMAKSYGVDYLLKKCDEHIFGSSELSLAQKLALADEMKNDELFGRLVRSLDEPSLKELAVNASVNVKLRGKAVERHFPHLPLSFGDKLALNRVLFAQETKDEALLQYVAGNLTKRELAHLKRMEHKDKYTKETLMALFGKAHSLIP